MNDEENKLTLKNKFIRNGRQRVNTLKIKVDSETGALMIYIARGHNRETDKKEYSLFVCEKENIVLLKEFVSKL